MEIMPRIWPNQNSKNLSIYCVFLKIRLEFRIVLLAAGVGGVRDPLLQEFLNQSFRQRTDAKPFLPKKVLRFVGVGSI